MKSAKYDFRHPMFGTSITNWGRLLVENGGVDAKFFLRALFVTLITVVSLPSRLISKLIYDKKIINTNISHPPIFIIGHWRSGTTFLHELISNDPALAHVSLWNTLLPFNFLSLEKIKKDLAKFLPTTRPMDMIKIDMNGPYEDDAGLATMGTLSFFHCLHFPRHAERNYARSVLFEGLDEKELCTWKKNYLYLLKAVTLSNGGKRLVLKNPANTAKIKTLLEMFPDARFIHIYRNPYLVYHSTMRLRTSVLEQFALQNTTADKIQQCVINDYISLMNSYFEQKDSIPNGQLVEISYEEFVSDPLKMVQQIYTALRLPGFDKALPAMKKHLEGQEGYVKNVYKTDEKSIDTVNKHWGFTVNLWGYKPPG